MQFPVQPTAPIAWPRWTSWPFEMKIAEQVGVEGRGGAAVVDDDRVAVTALPAGVDDPAAGGGGDRRAHRGADVDAGVHPEAAAERVGAHAEG